jgi:hypothetical protein
MGLVAGRSEPGRARAPWLDAELGPHQVERLSRLLSAAVLAVVVGLIPWTVFLGLTLPSRYKAQHWALAWVGFDMVLILLLAYTAWALWQRRQVLVASAIVLATMLLCDAWFDVTTSFGTRGELVTILTAVFAEIPAAIFFILLARRIMRRTFEAFAALDVSPESVTSARGRVRDVPLLPLAFHRAPPSEQARGSSESEEASR